MHRLRAQSACRGPSRQAKPWQGGRAACGSGSLEDIFSRRIRTRRWLVRYPRALPLGTFLLVAAITLLACYGIERIERRADMAELDEQARGIASALERRANANASYLRAGAALFATVDDVPASRFRGFVSELRLDADFRGAEGIGWAQRVDRGEVADFNRLVEKEYGPGVQLQSEIARGQPYAVPVTYLEPDNERNRGALGIDMFAEPVRRAAMLEAERTARPTSSGKVTLFQAGEANAQGFLMYMPVFERRRGARLAGYVYSVFNAQDFLASALQLEAASELGIRLYDREITSSALLSALEPPGGRGPVTREEVMIADHPWVLEVTGAKPAPLSRLALVTLLFGLAVAGMLSGFLHMLTRQATEDGARLTWFEEQNAIRDSLTRELNHRVKNTLANVLSIVALTRRRADTVDEFAEGLTGRIRALSATHDLLTRSEWGSTPIRAVIEAELAPYARETGPLIAIDGPDIELAPKDALSLGLAIHELATNAAKYGALSRSEGRLAVGWQDVRDGRVRLEWAESGGPPVPQERQRGFGTDLIEKVVAHELRSPVDLRFDPEGVRCALEVPVREPTKFSLRGELDGAG